MCRTKTFFAMSEFGVVAPHDTSVAGGGTVQTGARCKTAAVCSRSLLVTTQMLVCAVDLQIPLPLYSGEAPVGCEVYPLLLRWAFTNSIFVEFWGMVNEFYVCVDTGHVKSISGRGIRFWRFAHLLLWAVVGCIVL